VWIKKIGHSSFNYYCKGNCSWGWKKFIEMSDLEIMDKYNKVPLIQNNSVVICALVRIYRYKYGNCLYVTSFIIYINNNILHKNIFFPNINFFYHLLLCMM